MPPPKRSPPKHRHDGSSPLPLGMDWSPPPKKWDGRDTVWPHDPRTGWSYCVTIPSWIFHPEPGLSDDSLINPIVFYRVQIGIQSPEGITTACGIHRRFSDFLKLFSELKKAFPKKNIPQPPPKRAFLRINSSHMLLEERRYSLEEWMAKILSDIDLSRNVQVASFLELEAAARSSFLDTNQHCLEPNANGTSLSRPFPIQIKARSGSSVAGSSLVPSTVQSIASDCGSDNAYEASDEPPSQGAQHSSEADLSFLTKEHPEYSLSTQVNGLLGTESISDHPEQFSGSKIYSGKDMFLGNASGTDAKIELLPELDHDKHPSHSRKFSSESIGSDVSSIRGSEVSIPSVYNSPGVTLVDLSGREASGVVDSSCSTRVNETHVILPIDHRQKLNRLLITMQRRLVTAKTDMEDVMARLNQEMAVKEYLTTKVKDLEVELESTKQRSKENLQQAIMSERERVTQMQWDMDELQRKTLEMESKLKIEQNERVDTDSEKISFAVEKETLMRELDDKSLQLEILKKQTEDLELKSKSDIKVLSKEIKSLRNSQAELKETLHQSMKEKSELQRVFHKEIQRWRLKALSRKKLLYECGVLRRRLQECSVNVLSEEEELAVDPSSFSEALDTLTTSDNRIGLLLAEAQLLAQEDESAIMDAENSKVRSLPETIATMNGDDAHLVDDEVRQMLTDIFIDNARLRKQVNSIMRFALKADIRPEKEDDSTPRKTVLNRYLER